MTPNKNPYVLFRRDEDNAEEYQAALDVWGPDRCTRFRSDIPGGSLVVGRYSVLPFFRDVEDEVLHNGSRLINPHRAHRYIADMEWYEDLVGMTPRTWFNAGWASVPETPHGYVVKGKTNSRKFKWSTHMYAPDREALKAVCTRLYDDDFIASQGLVIREYVPLSSYEEGLNGMPVTNEWRVFFVGDELVASGYYWAQAEDAEAWGNIPAPAKALAQAAADIISTKIGDAGHPAFFVVDVGFVEGGGWTVIEINSGQMSGLSMIDPHDFYQRLKDVLTP